MKSNSTESKSIDMQLNERLTSMQQYPFAILAAKRKKLSDAGQRVFDFSKGDPIEPTPSFICEALRNSVPRVSQYPSTKGSPELRKAIVGYLKRRFAAELDPETQVIQSRGSKEAIYNLASVIIGPQSKKRVIIASHPGYMVCERSAVMHDAEFFPFILKRENGFLLDLATASPDLLERTAMVWLNYPHNPTGVSCSREYLTKQTEICKRYGILLCSDECYVDLYLGSTPHPSILQITTEGVLAFHSCSKRSGMTGYRSGFIAGDARILKYYTDLRDALGIEMPTYTQAASIAAWNDDAHVEERRKIFREKQSLFVSFFSRKGIEIAPNEATFYLWAKAPQGKMGLEYADMLLTKGIIVTPGEYFGAGGEDRFRVALVPSLQDCEEAIKLWNTL